MKKKMQQMLKRRKKEPEAPTKGSLESLSEYFDSYLSALEVVNSNR